MVGKALHGPVAGIYRDDIARFDRALDGVSYPALKWQLIAYAELDRGGKGGADPRTIGQLWALPTARYADFDQVLGGAARTSRGHPDRRPRGV